MNDVLTIQNAEKCLSYENRLLFCTLIVVGTHKWLPQREKKVGQYSTLCLFSIAYPSFFWFVKDFFSIWEAAIVVDSQPD